MSRADPTAPGIGSAARSAALDFYYHSIRLVAANLIFGAVLLAVLLAAWLAGPLIGAVLAPILALPLAGIARMASLIVRGEDVVLSDAWHEWRRAGRAALAAGVLVALAVTALATNLVVGLASDSPPGWAFATVAGWGLVVLWAIAFPFLAVVGDPARDGWSVADRMKLVGLLLLAEPGRLSALALVLAVLLAVGTVLFAALITIAVAFATLLAARVVLPATDRLVERMPGSFPVTQGGRAG